MSSYRVAVIGDIHANGRALEAALSVATKTGYDELVFLGDVLTYGIDVVAVTDKVALECQKDNVVLLRGNHDVLYQSQEPNDSSTYIDKLPSWIQESIAFTKKQLNPNTFESLPFIDSYVKNDIFFAHANPFGHGDWRYLNSEHDHQAACQALQEMGLRCGVFGHTHRTKIFSQVLGFDLQVGVTAKVMADENHMPYVINAGSVGQPRNESRRVDILVMDVKKGCFTADYLKVDYDVAAHVSALRQSSLSHETIEKLVSFFI